MNDIGLKFYFLGLPLSGLVTGQCCPHKMSWEVFPPFLFSGRDYVERILFLFQMFGGIHQ